MSEEKILEIELDNGETYPLTINYRGLAYVEDNLPKVYNSYNIIWVQAEKGRDITISHMDIVRIVYLGYLCGQSENLSDIYTLEEFQDVAPIDVEYMAELYGGIIEKLQGRKKKTTLEGHLKKEPKKKTAEK